MRHQTYIKRTDSPIVQRRSVLKAALIAVSFMLPQAARTLSLGAAVPDRSLIFHDPLYSQQDIRALGRAYRTLHPAEAERGVLLALLQQQAKGLNLDRTIRLDFSTGNTVRISGWILSRAEARVYALQSLDSAAAFG